MTAVAPIPPKTDDIMSPADAIPRPLRFSFLKSLRPLSEKINPKRQQITAAILETTLSIKKKRTERAESEIIITKYEKSAVGTLANADTEQINPAIPALLNGLFSGKTFPQLEQTSASFSTVAQHFGHFFISISPSLMKSQKT